MNRDIEMVVIGAYHHDPLIVNPTLAKIITKEDTFLSVKYYAREWVDKLMGGEIGIFNGRRIVINEPMRKPRLRGMAKLNKLVEEQKQSGDGRRFPVIQFKGIPKKLQRQGFKSGNVAAQRSTRAEKS